jgi:hypothetical protein
MGVKLGLSHWEEGVAGLSLGVFENRVLGKIFGSERVKVTRDTRASRFVRSTGNQMKKNEMGGACGTYGGNSNAYIGPETQCSSSEQA